MVNYQPFVTQTLPLITMRARSHILQKKSSILLIMRNILLTRSIRSSACLSTLLFWCATCVYAPSHAAVATATVTANVISSLGITTLNGLSFGDISASAIAGTIVMSPNGTRSATGGASFNSSGPGSPATFDIQGDANATYSITLPASVVLTDGSSNTMVVDSFSSSPTPSGVLDGSGQQTLFVGATLNVGSNQAFGSYSGLMSVTVAYN